MQKQFHLYDKSKILKETSFKKPRNRHDKPEGGFWTSNFDEEYISDWVQWHLSEGSDNSGVFSGFDCECTVWLKWVFEEELEYVEKNPKIKEN